MIVFIPHHMQGAALIVFGPTILDMARHVDTTVGILSAMFAFRAVGAAIGSIGTGVALDRGLKNYSYSYMTLVLISTTVSKYSSEMHYESF